MMVCNSKRPKQRGKGNCCDKNAKKLIEDIQGSLREQGLAQSVFVRESACLGNCASGINMKVFPGGAVHNEVTMDKIKKILNI